MCKAFICYHFYYGILSWLIEFKEENQQGELLFSDMLNILHEGSLLELNLIDIPISLIQPI